MTSRDAFSSGDYAAIHAGDQRPALRAGHLSGWGAEPWCHSCQSRTVRWHCSDRGCRVVSCLKCLAVTACDGGRLVVVTAGVERL